jgi:hypothetical protein
MPERALATITYENGYQALVDSLRARAQELRVALSSENFAQVSGLPSFYAAKLLSPSSHQVRRIGAISLGPLLGALSLKLIVMEDEKAFARFGPLLERRNECCVHYNDVITLKLTRRHMQKLGQKGMKVRWAAVRRRKAIASRAAQARWAKARGEGL